MKYAALNTGPDIHLLDHIAPLAEQFKAPLLIEEEKNIDLARRYYPQLEIRSFDALHLESLLEFDVLLECKKWAPHLKQLFLDFYRKKMRLVFCPHGFSDKTAPLASYASQDAVLIYGDLHREMLDKLGLEPNIWAVTGNYRFDFYRRYKAFYDHLANQEIFSQLKPQPTLLYAPTWADVEGGSSFFDWGPTLLDQLPSSWNLIVKVHPLLEIQQPSRYYSLAARIENKENTILVSEFPPIYPILSKVDAYLGDTSSIGYDFLIFDKPMFFLDCPHVKPGPLRQCGTTISRSQNIFRQIEGEKTDFSKERKTLFQRAFDPIQKS